MRVYFSNLKIIFLAVNARTTTALYNTPFLASFAHPFSQHCLNIIARTSRSYTYVDRCEVSYARRRAQYVLRGYNIWIRALKGWYYASAVVSAAECVLCVFNKNETCARTDMDGARQLCRLFLATWDLYIYHTLKTCTWIAQCHCRKP